MAWWWPRLGARILGRVVVILWIIAVASIVGLLRLVGLLKVVALGRLSVRILRLGRAALRRIVAALLLLIGVSANRTAGKASRSGVPTLATPREEGVAGVHGVNLTGPGDERCARAGSRVVESSVWRVWWRRGL